MKPGENNMPQITARLIKKIEIICRSISKKTGVPYSDLFSECLSKVPNILRNFDTRANKPFEPYLLMSCRGYALNYCRDKSFLSFVSRKNLYIYAKSKKFPNLTVASNSLGIPLLTLEKIHNDIRSLRSYNSVDTSEEWRLDIQEEKVNISQVLSELLTDKEVDVAIAYFVDKKESCKKEALVVAEKLKDNEEVLRDLLFN